MNTTFFNFCTSNSKKTFTLYGLELSCPKVLAVQSSPLPRVMATADCEQAFSSYIETQLPESQVKEYLARN